MKRILSMLLLTAMLVCLLAGCGGSDPKDLPGTWYGELDISKTVNTLLEAMIGNNNFSVSDLTVTLVLTLGGDGIYLLEADTVSVAEAFGNMMLQLEADMTRMIEDSISDEDLLLSAEEYLNLSGTTMEETMEQLAVSLEEGGLVDEIVVSTTSESSWFADESKLTFGATAFSYKIKDDKLTISGGEGDDAVLLALPSPLEFSKTNPNAE